MVDTDECKFCGADEDTWDHALLYSTSSGCIWADARWGANRSDGYSTYFWPKALGFLCM